jgi:hypothetical protein
MQPWPLEAALRQALCHFGRLSGSQLERDQAAGAQAGLRLARDPPQ